MTSRMETATETETGDGEEAGKLKIARKRGSALQLSDCTAFCGEEFKKKFEVSRSRQPRTASRAEL